MKIRVPDTFQSTAILPRSAFLASRKINRLNIPTPPASTIYSVDCIVLILCQTPRLIAKCVAERSDGRETLELFTQAA